MRAGPNQAVIVRVREPTYGLILKTSPVPDDVPRFDTYTLPSGPTATPVGCDSAVVIVVRVPVVATWINAPGPPKKTGAVANCRTYTPPSGANAKSVIVLN